MSTNVLEQNIRLGCLNLHLPDGTHYRYGDSAPEANWHIHDPAVLSRVWCDPELELGETYVEKGWDAENPEGLRKLLEVLMRNFADLKPRGWVYLRELLYKWLHRGNAILHSYRHIRHHYDRDEWLFRRFLDRGMFYSCAYFEHPGQSLEAAQQAKCELIRRKLLIEPGHKVLDIGSGWGGLAFYLAAKADVEVVGLTLSREQLRVAETEARKRGLSGQVRFLLQDYREHRGVYDHIVSVGMFEHVGLRDYQAFFRTLDRLLNPDGSALLHTIGSTWRRSELNPWMRRHIFPGAHIPLLSQIMPALEYSRLMLTDAEVLRLHYADTLYEWFRRFQAHRREVAERMDERFARIWEFYLAVCEATFRWWDLVVFQLQIAKRHGVIPITRDYLFNPEAREEQRKLGGIHT